MTRRLPLTDRAESQQVTRKEQQQSVAAGQSLTAQATPRGGRPSIHRKGSPMRNRSIRGLYVLAASIAVSSALGLAGATAASAAIHPHATTVCDNNPGTVSPRCTNISNLMLNQDNGPVFIQNATQKGVKAGSLYQNRIV